MALFKFIQNDKGQVLLNRNDLTGSAVLGTYDVHGTPAMTPVSDADLREFAEYILEEVPKPSPIKDARLVSDISTVGDLTARHIGQGDVRFILPVSTITGTITELYYDVQYEQDMTGKKLYNVTATVRVGNILLEDLPLSTPCTEVDFS